MTRKGKATNFFETTTSAKLQHLGLVEAENDKQLDKYYVGRDQYLVRALDFDDPICVFVGPKGVGKSAVLQMVRLTKAADANRIIDVRPDDLAFHSLSNIARSTPILEDAGRNQHLFKSLWDYVLAIEIAHREYKQQHIILKWLQDFLTTDYNKKQVQRLLKKTFDDTGSEVTLSSKIVALVEEIELSFSSGEMDGAAAVKLNKDPQTWSTQLSLLSLINDAAKALTRPDFLKNEYHILIDDLDLHWHGTTIQNAFIGSLFLSLRRLNNSPKLKFCVSLRDNIFEAIPIVDKDKIRDSVCRVEWEANAVKEMLNSRIINSIPSAKNRIWGELFPPNAFSILFSHTNGMPREMIRLTSLALSIAKQNGNSSVSASDMNKAFRDFAEERISDSASVYQQKYPALDRLYRRFRGKDREFNTEILREIAFDVAEESERGVTGNHDVWVAGYLDNPLGLARILLETGFLLFKSDRKAEPRPFDPDMDRLDENSFFAIHRMYAPDVVG